MRWSFSAATKREFGWSAALTQPLIGSIALGLAILPSLALSAPIPLDSSNWLGTTGAHYWRITAPGTYFLNVPESTFMTSYEYAIVIQTGNVVLDGAGKGISGTAVPSSTAPGTPNLYGVRVNGGTDVFNVRVTNLRVSNKYFGVIFEAVGDGRIDGVTATGNEHGLYFWRTVRTTLQYNIASNNLTSGILCDGNAFDSTSNTIADNAANGNGHSGIWLWDGCPNNTVTSNAASDNVQMGIALSSGANGNAVTFNVLQGNSTGVFVSSNGNTIGSNLAEDNTNVGILVVESNSNTLEANTVRRNLSGIWLDSATGNVIRRNTVANHSNWGIFHANGSAGQSIYDNYLSNANNAGFSVSGSNAWNVTLTPATNNVGGPYTGGNYWATPSRSGFSETASDADGNGIADAAYALGAGNVDSLPLHAKARSFPNTSFDGGFKGDLLWRKATTGDNALWFMNGLAVTGQIIAPVADAGWSIVGRESFDGDGKTDILWRHTDGRNAIWFMDGAALKPSSGLIAPVNDANWKVAGVGDMDGDGYADIVWRHAVTGQPVIWFMRGLQIKQTMVMAPVGLNWQIVFAADFDGDAKAEILWRDSATGENAMWWFDSYVSLGGALIAPAPVGWSIVATADFDGDGRADILWRHTGGQNVIWFQNGLTTTSWAFVSSVPTGWSVGWVGDCDGDGKADIVWRRIDGTTSIWLMNGASISASAFLGNTAGWTLIP